MASLYRVTCGSHFKRLVLRIWFKAWWQQNYTFSRASH